MEDWYTTELHYQLYDLPAMMSCLQLRRKCQQFLSQVRMTKMHFSKSYQNAEENCYFIIDPLLQ